MPYCYYYYCCCCCCCSSSSSSSSSSYSYYYYYYYQYHTPLPGLSWVFAFFAIEDARVVFQYLFTITTSLQGLLIFLVFTARDPAVRAFWRQACCGPSQPDKSSTDKTRTRGKEPGSSGSDHMPLGRSKQSSGDSECHVQTRRNTAPTYVVSESSGSGNGPGLVNHAYNERY